MALMWVQIFRLLVLYDKLAYYINMILELLKDISPFLILLGLSILMFANIQYILMQDDIEKQINDAKTTTSPKDAFEIRYTFFK